MQFNNLNRRLKFLIITGIIYILSLFTGNKYIMGITQWLFIGTILYNFSHNLKERNINMNSIIETSNKRANNYFNDKKYFKSFIQFSALPLCFINLIFLVIMTIIFYFG